MNVERGLSTISQLRDFSPSRCDVTLFTQYHMILYGVHTQLISGAAADLITSPLGELHVRDQHRSCLIWQGTVDSTEVQPLRIVVALLEISSLLNNEVVVFTSRGMVLWGVSLVDGGYNRCASSIQLNKEVGVCTLFRHQPVDAYLLRIMASFVGSPMFGW